MALTVYVFYSQHGCVVYILHCTQNILKGFIFSSAKDIMSRHMRKYISGYKGKDGSTLLEYQGSPDSHDKPATVKLRQLNVIVGSFAFSTHLPFSNQTN